MRLQDYQAEAAKTAVYPGRGEMLGLLYTTLGLNGEVGEFSEKLKKILRDKEGEITQDDVVQLSKELGDILWYLSETCTQLQIRLDEVAGLNLKKLSKRQENQTLHGSGDDR